MQKVKLVGEISKFGSDWETNCRDIRDIFKLIDCQTPGFRQHLVSAADAGISYEIQRGKDFLESPEELLLSISSEDIIITEVPSGSKTGAGKILAAAAIITIMVLQPQLFFTTTFQGVTGAAPTLAAANGLSIAGKVAAMVAVNLANTGMAQLMAPGPESDGGPENQGYFFDGPVNNVEQGLPVPVCYGELRVGGAPISVAFDPPTPSLADLTGSSGRLVNTQVSNFNQGTQETVVKDDKTWAVPSSNQVQVPPAKQVFRPSRS